jgi:hypothetical protein
VGAGGPRERMPAWSGLGVTPVGRLRVPDARLHSVIIVHHWATGFLNWPAVQPESGADQGAWFRGTASVGKGLPRWLLLPMPAQAIRTLDQRCVRLLPQGSRPAMRHAVSWESVDGMPAIHVNSAGRT